MAGLPLIVGVGLWFFWNPAESISFLPEGDREFAQELTLQNIFTYNDDVEIGHEKTDDGNVLKAVLRDEKRYTGFGIAREMIAKPEAVLRVEWRGSGKSDYVQVEVQAEAEGNPKLTWGAPTLAPRREWATLELPLRSLKWNENVNPRKTAPRPLPPDAIRGMEFTFPPGVDLALEIRRIEVASPTAKGVYVGGLIAFSLLLLTIQQIVLMRWAHRRTAVTLHESEARYEAIFEAVREGIVLIDPAKGSVLDANSAACAILGCDRGEISTEAEPLAAAVGKTGSAIVWEGQNGGGEPIRVEIATHALEIAGQQRLVAVLHDMTERQKLEAQLMHAQKMEAVGRLAGGVAHDFNNLLTGIICASELACSRRIDTQTREALDQIGQFVDRATALTRQLLAFSRRQPIERAPVSVTDLIGQMLKLLQRMIGEDIQLELEARAAKDTVLADAGQIEQVVMNLAVNARDAMPGGGKLSIRIDNVPCGGEEGTLRSPIGQCLRVRVRDTGHGIPEEILSQIFDPFFTTKSPGKGTGLGLAMIYGIIQHHGGRISVESAVGQGTEFTILLPAVLAVANKAPKEVESAVPRGNETILVIEDNEGVRRLVTSVLAFKGYHVLEADCTAAAESLLKRHAEKIELVISDVIMPGESGPEFIARVQLRYPQLRVLFISGYADLPEEIAEEFLNQWPLMMKPFRPEELCGEVRRILDAAPAGSNCA